jgi:class 3 adenylate cyclase
LAAILTVDVAGYSRLMGEDDEGTLAALHAVRRELGNPKIAEHTAAASPRWPRVAPVIPGRMRRDFPAACVRHARSRVKTTGAGLLVEFASVTVSNLGASFSP